MLPSYGHVKVLRNGFRRQRAGAATSLFSAPLPLFFPQFLVYFLFAYVVSFSMSSFKLFHCTLYCFFVLIRNGFVSF